MRDVDGSGYKEIPLYREGVNVTNNNDDPRLIQDLNCTPEATSLNSYITCNTRLNNLKLDGNYLLFIKIQDRAGNPLCNTQYSELDENFSCKFNNAQNIQVPTDSSNSATRQDFVIKTKTYLEITKPLETVQTIYANIEFGGQSEKGNTISISNSQLNQKIEFKNDLSSNQSLPKEYGLVENNWSLVADKDQADNRVLTSENWKLEIQCDGNFVNYDNLSETKDIEYCKYKIRLNQHANAVNSPASRNQNTVISSDTVGNIITKNTQVIIDINSLNLSSVPDYTAISPNGDGKFDKVIFTNKATIPDPNDSTKEIDFDQVDSHLAKITDTSGNTVWQKTEGLDNGKLPTNIEFDSSYNSSPIADGEYIYNLSLARNINSQTTTISTSNLAISIRRVVTGNVVLTSPSFASTYTTTRGVVNVQGELLDTSSNDEWKIELCFKLVDTNQAVSNNCVINSSVNAVKGSSNQSMGYIKPITINNTNATALTNYQTKIILDTQNLVTRGKLKDDCSDLRVKNTDKSSELGFWIEKGCNTATTTIWTKIPNLNPGFNTIYLSYGSSYNTTSASNGNNVFEFFDDFNGNNINTDIWTINNNTGFSLADGKLKSTNNLSRITSNQAFNNGIIYETKNSTASINPNGFFVASFFGATNPNSNFGYLIHLGNHYYNNNVYTHNHYNIPLIQI